MNYEQTWPIVVSAFENDWWDAAQIYRTWALASADWTKQGTMAQRMDKIPSWFLLNPNRSDIISLLDYIPLLWVPACYIEDIVLLPMGIDPSRQVKRPA